MLNLLLCLFFCISNSFKTNIIVPKKLWGKKIMENGPVNQNKYFSPFDGKGHITSVVFSKNETIISEVHVPTEKGELEFPISDFLERNYLSLISKFPYNIFRKDLVQSGTRNTAVVHLNNQYYAVEESCSPLKLNYSETMELLSGGKSSIPIMSAHLVDNYTMFSYKFMSKTPLKLNNTISIPWYPTKPPFLVHDCKQVDSNHYIFPLMSSGLGKFCEYFNKTINIPIDEKTNKAGWLLYNSKTNKCHEIRMDDYADIYHIAHIQHIYGEVYKIYTPFVYNFASWLTGNGELMIELKECLIDIEQKTVLQTRGTGLKMDFIHKKGDELIGSCLNNVTSVIKYNMKTKKHTQLFLKGKDVREIIPYEDYLLYFSHEANSSYLYIADITTGNPINKIEVPHRLPGFHTSLFD